VEIKHGSFGIPKKNNKTSISETDLLLKTETDVTAAEYQSEIEKGMNIWRTLILWQNLQKRSQPLLQKEFFELYAFCYPYSAFYDTSAVK